MRRAAAMVGLAALAGVSSLTCLAANRGVRADGWDRFAGTVDPAGDRDAFVVPVSSGGRLSVDLRAAAGSALLPSLAVVAPDGTPSSVAGFVKGEGTARVRLKNLPVLATGLWGVEVSGAGGTGGGYEISFRSSSPRKSSWKGEAVPQGMTASFGAAGDDGALLSFVLVVREGPAPGDPVVRDPAGAAVAIPDGALARRGNRVQLKKVPLTGGYGVYSVEMAGNAAGAAIVDASVSVRFPRPPRRRTTLGPEPRPASVDPSTGRDGIAVSVAGTGFLPGARVLFGESEAGSVEVVSGTEIRCAAPPGPESDDGLLVPVVVANPDGQENAVQGAFRYLGPPSISSVSPAYSPLAGGLTHTVAGGGFRPGFSLTVGGVVPAGISLVSGGSITFQGPARPAGTASVAVTDEFGRTAVLGTGIIYVGPPTITGASPASVSFAGGRPITVTGTNFRGSVEVLLDGIPVTGVSVLGATRLRFPMPAGPAGTFSLTVRDEFGQPATAAGLLRRRGPFVDRSATAVPSSPAGTDFFAASLALGDLDADGSPDLLVASPYANYDFATYSYFTASWLLRNDGPGTFTDGTAAGHAAFDVPGDHGQASVALLGDLDGAAGDEAVLSLRYPLADPYYVFTRNAKQYAYYMKGTYYNYPDYRTFPATRILSNDGTGRLSNATAAALPSPGSTPLFGYGERWQAAAGALGDLDGDGDLDLVLADDGAVVKGGVASSAYSAGVTYLLENWYYLTSARVLRNSGSGSFSASAGAFPAPYYMNGNYSYRVAEGFEGGAAALGDLDGDSDLDVVIARSYPRLVYYLDGTTGTYSFYYINATRVLANDGTGAFSWDPLRTPVAYAYAHPGSYDYWQADAVALGDLDGDGDRDLVLGRVQAGYWYETSSSSYRLLPAIRILANDGKGAFSDATGTFLASTSFRGGSTETILSARAVRLGDLDGDGSLDMVVAGSVYYVYNYNSTGYGYFGIVPAGDWLCTKVLLNEGTGALKDVTASWLPVPVNGDRFQASTAELGDLDGDGDLDLVLAADFYPDVYGVTSGHNRPLRVFENR